MCNATGCPVAERVAYPLTDHLKFDILPSATKSCTLGGRNSGSSIFQARNVLLMRRERIRTRASSASKIRYYSDRLLGWEAPAFRPGSRSPVTFSQQVLKTCFGTETGHSERAYK